MFEDRINVNLSEVTTAIQDNLLIVMGTEEELGNVTTVNVSNSKLALEFDRASFLKLRNLQELRIEHCCNLHILPNWFLLFQNLRRVHFAGLKLGTLDDNKIYLPKSVEDIEFIDCTTANPMMTLSDDIFDEMRNLRRVVFRSSKLEMIPSSLFRVENLHELVIVNSGSSIQLLNSLGLLTNLKSITLVGNNGNEKISILESISELSGIEKVELEGFGDEYLPISLKRLVMLRSFSFRCGNLRTLPSWITTLQNLSELCVDGNRFTVIPDFIGSLTNLRKLSFRNNCLVSIPDSLGNLQNLTELHLDDNQITEIPDSIGKLQNLSRLHLDRNQIKVIPGIVCNLYNLMGLHMTGNHLTQVPASIGNLSKLTVLYLNNNKISRLPDSIGHLCSLTALYLNNNQISTLNVSIGDLKKLRILHLSNNRLAILPESIKNLSKLKELTLLENNLVDVSTSNGLGKFEILRTFQDKTILYDEISPSVRISDEYFQNKLRERGVYWNFNKLRSLTTSAIQDTKLNESDMIDAVKELEQRGRLTVEDSDAIVEYIQKLYNPTQEYERWAMIDQYVQDAKNLLGCILEGTVYPTNTSTSCIDFCRIAKVIREDIPAEQLSELKLAYQAVSSRESNNNPLESFVYALIASEKEFIFDCVVKNHWFNLDTQALNDLKTCLKDTHGFKFRRNHASSPNSKETDNKQDSRNSDLELANRVLGVFFEIFTPECVIGVLTKTINSDKDMVRWLIRMIEVDQRLTPNQKKRMRSCERIEIGDRAVEYYLIEKEILLVYKEGDDSVFNGKCFCDALELFVNMFLCCCDIWTNPYGIHNHHYYRFT